jgi:uncharacterized protein (TIGR03083 family)
MTVADVAQDASRLGHRESMAAAAVEYARFLELIRSLSPTDWDRPTDCPPWDVKAVVSHNLGNLACNASVRENVRVMRTAMRRAKANGTTMVDELTALQVGERTSLSPTRMCAEVERLIPRALVGRRRVPALLRRTVTMKLPPPHDRMTLGFLTDQIYNRDMFMHRVDICRAIGRIMTVDDHERSIVAELVSDWADNHGQPFDLVLEGPAGGTYRRGTGGEQLRDLDAVQFARIVSGRHDGKTVSGLLATPVLF